MTRLPATILRDPALNAVLDAVEQEGHRAYLVGGVVRNALLGEAVADIDLSTDARPETVTRLAEAAGLKVVPTGIDHGTVTVVAQGQGFEITTFRRDVETDGRRAAVAFSQSLDEDARRRDFTMNALYADRDGQIIDPVGGLGDLAERRLRFVGEAEQRIREDYLRILRFFRFLAWYGREAEPGAVAACADLKQGLNQIAKERIGAEIKKLLGAPNPCNAVYLMVDAGILEAVLRGAAPRDLAALLAAEGDRAPSWSRRLALLAPDDAVDALRLSRDEAKEQGLLAQALARNWSLDEAGYRLKARRATDYTLIRAARGMALPEGWQDRIARAAAAQLPIAAKDLMPDLSGPALGHGLTAAERLWIASGFQATRSELIAAARSEGAGS